MTDSLLCIRCRKPVNLAHAQCVHSHGRTGYLCGACAIDLAPSGILHDLIAWHDAQQDSRSDAGPHQLTRIVQRARAWHRYFAQP